MQVTDTICLVFSNNVSFLYAQLGSSVILKCNDSNSITSWQDIESRAIIEICQDFNETTASIRRKYITKECHLKIRNLTHTDVHKYRCNKIDGYTDINVKIISK